MRYDEELASEDKLKRDHTFEQGRQWGINEALKVIDARWLHNPYFSLDDNEERVVKIICGQLEDLKGNQ